EPEGPLVHPLKVVYGKRERTERRQRPMRRLEDPERLTSLLIAAPEHEPFETRTVDRNRRPLAGDVADGGQRPGLGGFKSEDAEESLGPGSRQSIRVEPGRSAGGPR